MSTTDAAAAEAAASQQARLARQTADGAAGGEDEPRNQQNKAGGPVAWMVRKSLIIQTKLQVLFGWQAKVVCEHPSRCIWGAVLWMTLVLPAALLGRVELRNDEVLLPQDARELDAANLIRSTFGEDWGSVSLIYAAPSGGDILTQALLTEVATAEAEALALTAVEPDDASIIHEFSDVCELQYPTYADGSTGPCFFMSLFAPGTLWNQLDPSTGKHATTSVALANLLSRAAALETDHPTAPVDGIHLAATEFYANVKGDLFMNGILGTVTQHPTFTIPVTLATGGAFFSDSSRTFPSLFLVLNTFWAHIRSHLADLSAVSDRERAGCRLVVSPEVLRISARRQPQGIHSPPFISVALTPDFH